MPIAPKTTPLLVRALRREPVERVPVWIMRQAGRYLPEYLEVRKRASFIDVCLNPDLCVEITMQPLRRYDLDAAIIFSDILLPLRWMGAGFDFEDKPKLDRPIRTREQIDALTAVPALDSGAFEFLHEAQRRVRAELPPHKALIGFAGSPFTLANYLIEGGGSEQSLNTKRLLFEQPEAAHALLDKLTDAVIVWLRGQIERGGVDAVQVFESSGAVIGPGDYARFALPYAKKVIEGVKDLGAPAILFPRGCGAYLEAFSDCGADGIGIDWQTPLASARARLGGSMAIQGNLDPVTLFAPRQVLEKRIETTLAEAGDLRGYVFNLGHGILPETPVESVQTIVDTVRRVSQAHLQR